MTLELRHHLHYCRSFGRFSWLSILRQPSFLDLACCQPPMTGPSILFSPAPEHGTGKNDGCNEDVVQHGVASRRMPVPDGAARRDKYSEKAEETTKKKETRYQGDVSSIASGSSTTFSYKLTPVSSDLLLRVPATVQVTIDPQP